MCLVSCLAVCIFLRHCICFLQVLKCLQPLTCAVMFLQVHNTYMLMCQCRFTLSFRQSHVNFIDLVLPHDTEETCPVHALTSSAEHQLHLPYLWHSATVNLYLSDKMSFLCPGLYQLLWIWLTFFIYCLLVWLANSVWWWWWVDA